jgi:hypothetical protein
MVTINKAQHMNIKTSHSAGLLKFYFVASSPDF